MKVNALLSGILVMTALYSINLMLLGRSNVPIIGHATVFDAIAFFDNESLNQLITLLGLLALLVILMFYVLRTDFGIAMRATGNNPFMTKALGINNNSMRIIGLALANACTAWSGFLMTQYQGFADINMGIGIVITGLGSVLIADSLIQRFKIRNLLIQLLLVVGGCMLFEGVLGLSLSLGADPMMLKLITAVFVLMIVGIPGLLSKKLSD
jgi:putative ABC transport system permease protein